MKPKQLLSLLTGTALLLALLAGCGGDSGQSAQPSAQDAPAAQEAAVPAEPATAAAAASDSEGLPEYTITLSGDSITAPDAQVDGSSVTITKPGVYRISGTLTDGQILVETDKEEKVVLLLDGVDITCSNSAPIYVKTADKVTIETAAGTVNAVTDGSSYALSADETEPDAAIFSKEDLTFTGEGTLTVTGNCNMAVHSKDDLVIQNGTLVLTSAGDGLKGKDSVTISGGDITITAGDDGIQTSNETEKGDLTISGGTITLDTQGDGMKAANSLIISGGTVSLTAQKDGLQAVNASGAGGIYVSGGSVSIDAQKDATQSEGDLEIADGVINIVTGGGSLNAPEHQEGFGPPGWFNDTVTDDTASAKGLKAAGAVTISGGQIFLDTYDDAIHAGSVTVSDQADLTIAAGDDAIHADDTLTVSGGVINITKSYEGMEALYVELSGGDVTLVSDDDGINANGEELFGFGTEGAQETLEEAATYVHITGGILNMDASGDGLDSNGALFLEGGEVYVSGPEENMNGALDYTTTGQVTGGVAIIAGSSGMTQNFDSSSTQGSILYTFSSAIPAGSTVSLRDSSGEVLAEAVMAKTFTSVVITHPNLTVGETYTLTCGEETADIELTELVTTAGSGGFGGFGFGGPGGGPGFGGPPGGPPGF